MLLPAVFHLMWRQELLADLTRERLGPATVVQTAKVTGWSRVSGERRPRRLGGVAIGDRVRLAGALHTVIAVSGTGVRLADTDGVVSDVGSTELATVEDFEAVDAPSRSAVLSSMRLDGLPEAVVAEALWWEQHIVEVLRGVPPQAPPGTRPKPEYDPTRVSLTRREQTKASELTAAGNQ